MPLSKPIKRDLIHTRNVDVSCYRRTDGLWDVDGHLTDLAAVPVKNYTGGVIEPGTPIHDMNIRLTLNETIKIVAVEVSMEAHPYPLCPGILPAYQRLKGETIGRGWHRRVRELFGGVNGCVHIVDLLGPVGTLGFKNVKRDSGQDELPPAERRDDKPYQINTCHALASNGEIVRARWPGLYTGG